MVIGAEESLTVDSLHIRRYGEAHQIIFGIVQVALHDVSLACFQHIVLGEVLPCIVEVLCCSLGSVVAANHPLRQIVLGNDVRHLHVEGEGDELPAVVVQHHVDGLVLSSEFTFHNQRIGIVNSPIGVVVSVRVEEAVVGIILSIGGEEHREIVNLQLTAVANGEVAALVLSVAEAVVYLVAVVEHSDVGFVVLEVLVFAQYELELLIDDYIVGTDVGVNHHVCLELQPTWCRHVLLEAPQGDTQLDVPCFVGNHIVAHGGRKQGKRGNGFDATATVEGMAQTIDK